VFGFPVSRPFVLLGCDVQIFQRQIAQACAGQGVTLMNLLDPEIFPYEHVNGSALPGPDMGMKAETPVVGSQEYDTAIVDFVRDNAPDSFEDQGVGFGKTFFSKMDDSLANLEVWGVPVSRPQRGLTTTVWRSTGSSHYNTSTGSAGLLSFDYIKAICAGATCQRSGPGSAR
jgi:hypothetical protein